MCDSFLYLSGRTMHCSTSDTLLATDLMCSTDREVQLMANGKKNSLTIPYHTHHKHIWKYNKVHIKRWTTHYRHSSFIHSSWRISFGVLFINYSSQCVCVWVAGYEGIWWIVNGNISFCGGFSGVNNAKWHQMSEAGSWRLVYYCIMAVIKWLKSSTVIIVLRLRLNEVNCMLV